MKLLRLERLRSYVMIENAWDARSNDDFSRGAVSARNRMLKVIEDDN